MQGNPLMRSEMLFRPTVACTQDLVIPLSDKMFIWISFPQLFFSPVFAGKANIVVHLDFLLE